LFDAGDTSRRRCASAPQARNAEEDPSWVCQKRRRRKHRSPLGVDRRFARPTLASTESPSLGKRCPPAKILWDFSIAVSNCLNRRRKRVEWRGQRLARRSHHRGRRPWATACAAPQPGRAGFSRHLVDASRCTATPSWNAWLDVVLAEIVIVAFLQGWSTRTGNKFEAGGQWKSRAGIAVIFSAPVDVHREW